MAVFTVLNGAGLNGAGIQFGTLSQIASSGLAGADIPVPTAGAILFLDGGELGITGTGMSFTFPLTYAGTVDSLTYSTPLSIQVFSITGASVALADLVSGFNGGGELAMLATIFSGNDTISGSTQADLLIGFDGNDTINGGDGNDTLRGGAGRDALDGGNGLDFANYQGSSEGVVVDLKANLFFGGDATGDVLTNIENIYGSNSIGSGDALSGSDARNIIGGANGDDIIRGNGGDDSLAGEAGNDSITAGDGNDRLIGGDGADVLTGDDGLDIAGDGNDSIDGGAGNDQIYANAGNDSLTGGAGDDEIHGQEGNDILEGGAGADTLDGGAGIDTASYASSAAGVTVVVGGTSLAGDAQGDTLTSIEQVMGSGFNDRIFGGANGSANTLWGLAGDDVLIGAGGADVLKGGAGNDYFTYTDMTDSTVALAGKDVIVDFATGDKIELFALDADGDIGNGNTAFTFGTGAFTGVGQIRVLAFANNRYGVYLETTGDKQPDAIINVYSDHALTAADFVL